MSLSLTYSYSGGDCSVPHLVIELYQGYGPIIGTFLFHFSFYESFLAKVSIDIWMRDSKERIDKLQEILKIPRIFTAERSGRAYKLV